MTVIYSEHDLDLVDEHDAGMHSVGSPGCPACSGWGAEQ